MHNKSLYVHANKTRFTFVRKLLLAADKKVIKKIEILTVIKANIGRVK
jgi:hypothetical protein